MNHEQLCDKCKQEECPRCEEKAQERNNTIENIKYVFYGFLYGIVYWVWLTNKDEKKMMKKRKVKFS